MPKFSKCKILVGKILTIQHALVKFIRLFHHQSFTLYGIFAVRFNLPYFKMPIDVWIWIWSHAHTEQCLLNTVEKPIPTAQDVANYVFCNNRACGARTVAISCQF